ncbi:DUF4339 domain-containing protein [Flavobacterium muglaense]|uniref:DUF4339 domain-containing protein n=1 Tax=Flavobacterium muglaense TaxID=2764716 RepID=A0A923SJW3_9FLAO|nr:DUF4339 domain-containing protein [Flavobacterium muglaense]MBC5838129.1 DUF4339 domain-containing protein [Flavobacterium muglaense]MBC5844663.1 DUF4339 domain-containing protein [Flavobacterium muglaense]
MRVYYINNGGENGGPFTIEELKKEALHEQTLVWFQGMDDWQYAKNIVELKPFFTVIPPPIQRAIPKPETKVPIASSTIYGIKKSYFFLAIAFLVIMAFVLVLTLIQNSKRAEIELKNKETEFGNVQIELQQKESIEERIQDEIQKRIISENNNTRRKDSINARLTQIKSLIVDGKNQLTEAKKSLSDAEDFKLLRSENTKEEQLKSYQADVDNWKREIDELENESNRLYLMLETVH